MKKSVVDSGQLALFGEVVSLPRGEPGPSWEDMRRAHQYWELFQPRLLALHAEGIRSTCLHYWRSRWYREVLPNMPLHALGVEDLSLLPKLKEWGIQSVDSSLHRDLSLEGSNEKGEGVPAFGQTQVGQMVLNLACLTGAVLPLSTYLALGGRFT